MTQDNKEKPYLPLIDKAEKLSADYVTPSTVAVLGAGTMGLGIASVLTSTRCGIRVNLYDIDEGQLESAKGMDGVRTTTYLSEAIKDAHLVIEAVPEVLSLKKEIVAECSDDKFIATNTSTFKVQDISSSSNFGGMHFFNPVQRMPLVEIVVGEFTSEETVGVLCKTAIAMDKIPLVCNDCSGFVVNRMLMPYLIEFDKMISEGHNFVHIDTVMKNNGWPMGPAELCDLVGLDVIYHGSKSMENAYDHISVSKESKCYELYKNKTLGRKTHGGFYSYDDVTGRRLLPLVKAGDIKELPVEIKDRLISPMLSEASMLLTENIVESPAEINAALTLGAGLPPFTESLLQTHI